jgi:hypothetical protein
MLKSSSLNTRFYSRLFAHSWSASSQLSSTTISFISTLSFGIVAGGMFDVVAGTSKDNDEKVIGLP